MATRAAQRFLHVKCRNTTKPYLKTKNVFRCEVPDEKVDWKIPFDDYDPIHYTADSIRERSWADECDPRKCTFNTIDGKINRISHTGKYELKNGVPLNPFGRTGLCERGVLGRWGPNHAADAIVSRFCDGQLQFVGIQRRDTGEWAITGGMVDAGESPLKAAEREFVEEALADVDDKTKEHFGMAFQSCASELYRGYVDDPRNTDNAWMETVVYNFHDTANLFDNIRLKAGDDATNVKWITIEKGLPLYASHEKFIKFLLERHEE